MFTMRLYRDSPRAFRYLNDWGDGPLRSLRAKHPGIHFGELLAEISPKRFKATRHEVVATPHTQRSIVFFVLPSWGAVLPSGQTVESWMVGR